MMPDIWITSSSGGNVNQLMRFPYFWTHTETVARKYNWLTWTWCLIYEPPEEDIWTTWGGYMNHLRRLYEPPEEVIWTTWGYMNHLRRIYEPPEDIWATWGGYMNHLRRIYEPPEEVIWTTWGGYMNHLKRIYEPPEEDIWTTWGGYVNQLVIFPYLSHISAGKAKSLPKPEHSLFAQRMDSDDGSTKTKISSSTEYINMDVWSTVQSFITLCLWSIGMDCVISESCYKGTILQRHYREMTMKWSFSYDSFVKFYEGIIGKWAWKGHFPTILL